MSRSNNQDDTIVPWDDFSSTQLERAEQFAVRKHELSVNNENDVQNQFVFPSNSSKSALDVFLDDLLSLPTKNTTKLRAPLGDISNKRPLRPNSKSSIKEKEKKRQPTPVLTRMDSLDDNIWTEFDSDLLSLIDVEPKKDDESTSSTSPRNTATPTKADPSKIQKKAIDDMFEKKHQNKEVSIPSFTTARGFALPAPSKEAKLKAARILETADKKDDISLPINVDENLFLPPSTTTESRQDLSPMSKDTLSQNDNASLSSSSSTSISKVETITKDEDDSVYIPSYDDVFLPLSFSYKPLPPPGVTQPKTDIPDPETPLSPTYKHNVIETEIEPIVNISKDELPPLPISIDESLFVPQVTEDGHVIKELPTPKGPEAGFQSARSIKPIEKKIENDKIENGQKDKSVFEAKSPTPDELNEIEKPSFMTTSEKKSKELDLERDDKIDPKEPVGSEMISSPKDISKEIRKPSFMTASRTKLKEPSAEALQKAATLFKDSKNPLTHDTVINQFGGFQTGNSKKSFDISSQAKRRAISVFSDESEAGIDSKKARFASPINKNKASNLQNKTTTNNFTNPEIESLPSKRHWEDEEEDEEEDNTVHKLQKYNSEAPAQLQKPSFVTAAGNKLKAPSAESVQKAAALFTDAEKTEKYDKVIHQFGGFQMGNSKKSFDISSQAQRKAISIFNEPEETATDAEAEAKTIRLSPTPITMKKPGALGRHVTFSPRKDSTNSLEQNKSVKHVLGTSKKDVTKLDGSSNPGSPTGTSSKSSSPIGSPISKPSSPVSLIPKRNISRPSIATRKNKPFKSPIIQSNLELTKAAVHNRGTAKAKLTPVFNLEAPSFRMKLSSLGQPGQFTRTELLANNIPMSVINMTSSAARKYVFEGNWGPKEARNDLIKAGALSRRITFDWVENHYGWIVWKIACLIRSYNQFTEQWKSQTVLNQLLYRYEREINNGNRPVLRKILEKDDLPMKHMILMISDIIEIKSAAVQNNTSSKYRLQLSDGWYQVPACIDLRMEKAITKKKLKIGSKLSICGASIIGGKEGINPLENTDNSTMLSITTNGSLPARWDTKLGYHPRKMIIRKLPSIFFDGGIVSAIDIVVCRKFPILYSETLPNGMMVTRNAKEEEEARREALGYDIYGVRQQQSSNNKKETAIERRVSGYFKIRICDHISEAEQPWATLLLSNANELNHMDISEGYRYKIFFVVPYHPKNKKYPGLDLKTTRVTRWEPAPTLNSLNSYKSRFLTKCDGFHLQDLSTDFDLVVLVLQTGPATLEVVNGRKLYKQTLIVTDESSSICRINFRLPIHPFSNIKGQVLGLLNLRYEMYDTKFDITCLKATDESESMSKISSAPEYIQKGIIHLKQWVQKHPDTVQEMYKRLQNIVQ